MAELITPKLKRGYSPPVMAGGKRGRFNFDLPPETGGTPSARYAFETDNGGTWYYQLEKDLQGGRWEDAHHAADDYSRYSALDPSTRSRTFEAMWGPKSEISASLSQSIDKREPWGTAKSRLKPFDTWRQISEGEPEPVPEQEIRVFRLAKPDGTVEDVPVPDDVPDSGVPAYVKSYTANLIKSPGTTPIGLRAKLSFAESEAAQRKTLENLYGPNNVGINDGGKLQYREHNDEPFRPVNPTGFDLGDLAEYAGDAPEMILGTVGAIVGSGLGGAGAVGGAALGTMGGRTIKRGIGTAMGVPQPGMAQDLMSAGTMGAVGELGGQTAVKVAGKLIAPFAKYGSVTPEAQAAIDWMDKHLPAPSNVNSKALHAIGGPSPRLLPAEATESRMLDFVHNLAEGSIAGGGVIKAFKENRQQLLGDFAEDFANQFGAAQDPALLGTTVKQVIEGNYQAVHLPAQAILNGVEQKVGHLKVDIKPIKAAYKGLIEKSAQTNDIGKATSGANIAEMLAGLEDEIPLSAATFLRANLRSIGAEFSAANKKAPAIGVAKGATAMVHDAIGATMQKHAPAEFVEWNVGNSFYKNAETTYNNKFLRRLIQLGNPDIGGEPEMIVKNLFQNGKSTRVETAKRVLDPPTFRQLTSYMLHDKMRKAIDPKTGMMDADKLTAMTLGPNGLGEKIMRTTLGDNYDAFTGMLNAMKHAQHKQAEGTGSMFIQLAQSGAIVKSAQFAASAGTAAAGFPGTGAAILMAPYAVAKVMTTRLGMRLMTEGYKLPANSPLGMGVVGRLLALQTQMADVEMLSDAQAETETKIPPLPTKRFNVAPGGAPQ